MSVVTYQFDDFDLEEFLTLGSGFGANKFAYVVTPNADHLIRFADDLAFQALYADASYILLDSRFLSYVLRVTKGLRTKVCTGSDLTACLFSRVISPNDGVVLIGGSEQQSQTLAAIYGLKNLSHYNPPMGFVNNPKMVEECLQFIESHSPFRFCFLAVGSPQQEILAQKLLQRGKAKGMALCIGASINFLTGSERRAPRWMQLMAMEWLYRLVQDPGRMAKRYLVRGPKIFWLLRKADIKIRPIPSHLT